MKTYLTLLLLIYSFVMVRLDEDEDNDIFLIGSNNWCITNSSSAMIFNEDLKRTTNAATSVSIIYPSPPTSKFNCDFENNGNCYYSSLWIYTNNDGWQQRYSINTNKAEIITDQRWEDFPVWKTDGNLKQKLVYTEVLKDLYGNISIPMSIRIEKEAHIYLCDGDKPVNSNCYWIMLGMDKGTKSKIRKCKNREIPSEPDVYPKNPDCKAGLTTVNVNPLDESEWKHFLIQINMGKIKVYHDNKIFLEISDSSDWYNVHNMFIHSKNVNGLWKIHKYTFLESSTKTTNLEPLGPAIKINEEICILVYIKTSDNALLTIKINSGSKGTVYLKSFSTNDKWEQIKVYIKVNLTVYYEDLLLHFAKTYESGVSEKNGYWAIDDIRQCHNEEFRYLPNSDGGAECQLISLKNQKTINLHTYKKKPSHDDINCEEDRFGDACIPCKIFGQEFCSLKDKYCEWDQKTCHCSAGSTGKNCDEVCPEGFYGHGCRDRSHCLNNNRVNGYCSSPCDEPFIGNSCNETSTPFFKDKPTVSEIKPTSFQIQQVNLEIEGKGSGYYFEYSKIQNPLNWIRTDNSSIPLSHSPVVTVGDVEPDTEYIVRAIVFDRESKFVNGKKYNRPNYFSTSCKQIEQDDIMITPSNITATIKLQLSSYSCKKYDCYISNERCNPFSRDVFTVSNLKPHTEYTIVFNHSTGVLVSKLFITKDGVPSEVQNIVQDNILPNLIMLSWDEPSETNGDIVGYEIRYRSKNQACSGGVYGTFFSQNSTEKIIKLDNLMPYNNYEINIRALNNDFKGVLKTIFVDTLPATEISKNEKIKILDIQAEKDYFLFKMNEILCNDIKGPIKIKMKIFCISQWCNGRNTTYQIFDYISPSIRRVNKALQPYTNNTLMLSVSRNQSKWVFDESRDFTTKTAVPNSVAKFNVYTKDEHSISLRWIPPYPPTGILEKYEISYTYYWRYKYFSYNKNIALSETKCKLWNEFHCASITKNILVGYDYEITISAKNVDPDGYGVKKYINVNTIEEASEPPYDLSYIWTDKNELFIYWFHPNNTNGLLKSFEIIRANSDEKPIFKYIPSEKDYKLEYKIQYKFKTTFIPCGTLELYIGAHNVHKSSQFVPMTIKNPPTLPPNDFKSFKHTSTNYTIYLDIMLPVPVQSLLILVSKSDEMDDLQLFEEGLRNTQDMHKNLSFSRIVYQDWDKNCSIIFEIGNENYTSGNWLNPPLSSGTNYSISVFLINTCNGMPRVKRIQKFIITEGNPNLKDDSEILTDGEKQNDEKMSIGGLWALVLLVLIPLVLYGIWYAKKNNIKLNQIIPPGRTQEADELPLTEKRAPTATPKIHVVKPKASIVLPALQTKHSKKVPIIDFENYVKESIESGELEKQHNLFPKGLLKPHNVGSLPENKNKNRYKNLIAYDHTRVKIKYSSTDDNNVGYINANYIEGYRKPRAYIATQGPKSNTLNDFWWMIWRENIKDIIMLANIHENGKKKVDKYWPDINEEKTYGFVKVQYVSETVFANFVLRIFNVQFQTHERKVTQMHYTTWPDHGVPLYSQSLVPFLQRLLKIPHNSLTPILVHCSAGVGRTGTIILSDICLRMAAGEGYLDFLAHLENLRNQRANLVDNIEQYKLAHLVVLECLFGMRTSIPCTDEMRDIVTATLNSNGIKTQMKYILDTQWQDTAMETMLESDEVPPIYHEKNRFKDIIPENYRVYITRYPQEDEKSSYINAVLVDDFCNPGRYVVTQQPMPNTLGDFWRLVLERSCTVIISLNTLNLDDKTVCQIWPDKGEEMNPVEFIKLVHKKTRRLNFYKIITIQMEIKQARHSIVTDGVMEVRIIALDNWRSEDLLPNSIEEFLAFRDAADALSRTCEQVIVSCYDGAKASGLYLALSFMIEQMKLEQECDVCLAVRSLRHSRKQFVTTEEQYEFLYRAAVAFITGFQPYSNFS